MSKQVRLYLDEELSNTIRQRQLKVSIERGVIVSLIEVTNDIVSLGLASVKSKVPFEPTKEVI